MVTQVSSKGPAKDVSELHQEDHETAQLLANRDGLSYTLESSSSSDGSSAAPSTSLSWNQWRLLACLSTSSLLAGSCIIIQTPFYSHEASLRGLSSTATATVFSIFALSQLLAFPVMGWLAPRLGVTRLYRIGVLLAGITTVVFGLLTYVERPTPRV